MSLQLFLGHPVQFPDLLFCRAPARHEIINRRIRQFRSVGGLFRHYLFIHGDCFYAATRLAQLQIENGTHTLDVQKDFELLKFCISLTLQDRFRVLVDAIVTDMWTSGQLAFFGFTNYRCLLTDVYKDGKSEITSNFFPSAPRTLSEDKRVSILNLVSYEDVFHWFVYRKSKMLLTILTELFR